MNLYHLNTGVDSKVLLNADYDIRRYTDFISNAIKFLEKETLFIKVKKHIAETETIVNGKKKITKETRYIPELPKNKREEKAIEILFNENTRNIFDQNKDFKSGSIRIIDQNEDENYIVLADDIEGDTIFLNPDTYQLRQQKQLAVRDVLKGISDSRYGGILNPVYLLFQMLHANTSKSGGTDKQDFLILKTQYSANSNNPFLLP
ncbi:MAG: hypothetical protein M9931_05725 [Chitinophagales bacterium]|nr:hypothetical protein [Chitinophagales bacterium]